MTNLSRDQVNVILNNAPAGVDKASILDGLIERGYSLEGVDTNQARNSILERRKAAPIKENPFDNKIGKSGGLGGFITKGFNTLFGGGKLAQGAGQALAGKKPIESMSQALQQGQDLELKLMQEIRANKQAGIDTSRLEKVLFEQQKSNVDAEKLIGAYTGSLKTGKEVFGSAARLAGSIAAPTIGGVVAGKVAPAAPGIIAGATRGAKIGVATGAIEGAVQGSAIATEQNRSAEEALYGAAIGVTGGAITGGLLGGAIGGWGGYKAGQKVKAADFADDLTSPKLTAKERAKAIAEGRMDEPGFFRKAKIKANSRDLAIADSVRDVVDPKQTITANIDAIDGRIKEINQGVESYVASNKVPFNRNQVKTQLMNGKDDLQLVFASDSSAEKTYNKVVDIFMDQIEKGDTASLLRARKDFDSLPAVKKLLETDALGENARREIVTSVRGQANRYIADLLPKGNTFRADLLQEHYMIEALGNIGEKAANDIGKTKLQLLLKEYPYLSYLAPTVFGGGLGAGAVNYFSN